MNLSKLASAIVESPTLKLNEEARLLREKGEPVIHLGIGEPKNKTPEDGARAAAAIVAAGQVKYGPSAGSPALRKAIVQYTERHYGRTVAPQNVIVTAGAKLALFNVLYSLVDEGDEVVLLAPYWVSYPEMVKMVRGVPVVVTPPLDTLQPSLADIEKVAGPRTRAILVNSPNNPSGVVYPESFLAALIDFCERRGIWVIMDDIYHQLVFDGHSCPSAYKFTSKDIESTRVILVNGVSKLYGMTGYRVGWVVANRALVSVINNVQAATTTCVSSILQAGAEGALAGDQGVVAELRRTIAENRAAVMKALAGVPGVRCVPPGGTFYCLPDFRGCPGGLGADSLALCELLLRKVFVVTVPGKEFGLEGHLRLSYAGARQDVEEGLARLRWALDPAAPREYALGGRQVTRDWL